MAQPALVQLKEHRLPQRSFLEMLDLVNEDLPAIAKVLARTIDRDFRDARDWGC